MKLFKQYDCLARRSCAIYLCSFNFYNKIITTYPKFLVANKCIPFKKEISIIRDVNCLRIIFYLKEEINTPLPVRTFRFAMHLFPLREERKYFAKKKQC